MIQANNVSKYFGAKRALGPVSFEIGDGETVGFLGLNGAGKTTALRIFACDLRPSAGTVRVGDIDALASPHEVRKRVGYLPESPPLYPDMLVAEYLQFAGTLRGMSRAEAARRIPEVLDTTDLTDVKNEIIRELSHGYRQRVGVAQSIVHDPQLLILDEPTRGLDPVQIVEMRNMIRSLKEKHTVLISSHLLTEISETCDRILVLGRGEILATGTEDELSARLASASRLEVAVVAKGDGGAEAVQSCIKAVDGVSSVESRGTDDGASVYEVGSSEDRRAEVCRALIEAGHDVVRLDRGRKELESIFLKLVQGGTSASN